MDKSWVPFFRRLWRQMSHIFTDPFARIIRQFLQSLDRMQIRLHFVLLFVSLFIFIFCRNKEKQSEEKHGSGIEKKKYVRILIGDFLLRLAKNTRVWSLAGILLMDKTYYNIAPGRTRSKTNPFFLFSEIKFNNKYEVLNLVLVYSAGKREKK